MRYILLLFVVCLVVWVAIARGNLSPKKVRRVIVGAVILIVLLIGLYLIWFYWISPLQVGSFTLADYTQNIEKFPSEKVVGPITDAKQAKEKGTVALMDVFGEEKILGEKPIRVCYDENTDSWLVYGSLPPIPFMLGGVAKVIIRGSDGAVLALWHEK